MSGQVRKYMSGNSSLVLKAILVCALVVGGLVKWGCYIPGFGGDVDDPPGPTDPGGYGETLFGKFYVQQMGGGKVKTLSDLDDVADHPATLDYIVGETYFPSNNPVIDKLDYNMYHVGDGTYQTPWDGIYGNTVLEQTIFYKDVDAGQRNASSYPEGLVTDGELALYYTNYYIQYVGLFFDFLKIVDERCNLLDWPQEIHEGLPPAGQEVWLNLNSYYISIFNNWPAGVQDVDIYTIQIDDPGTMVVFRLRFQAIAGSHSSS